MASNNRVMLHQCPVRQDGLAIGVILVAVALVAALGMVIAASSSYVFGYSSTPKDDALASALIAEARNLRGGVDTMTARGTSISSITFDTSTTAGLFNPSIGGTDLQAPVPMAQASTSASWVWKVDASGNPTVNMYNVGTSQTDYVAILPNVEYHVCYDINGVLNNYSGIPGLNPANATLTNLTTPATVVDLSASNSGTQGWSEGCYVPVGSNWTTGPFVYIVTIRAR